MNHDPDRPVRHLAWRVRLFGAGAILALVGMYYGASWLTWLAIAVLLVGFALRYVPEREPEPESGAAPGESSGKSSGKPPRE